MPWTVKRQNGHTSSGKKTRYIVISKATGKVYHTNNPKRLEKLHAQHDK